MNDTPYEIERKFLIRMPSDDVLGTCCDRSEIVQTYLISPHGTTDRVRMRVRPNSVEYTHTVKSRISDIRRKETEFTVAVEEYEQLLRRADPQRKPVHKTRYILNYNKQSFEIDVYGFWTDRAIMELELVHEEQTIDFPPQIEIIREVTHDRRYTNAAIARTVPADEN